MALSSGGGDWSEIMDSCSRQRPGNDTADQVRHSVRNSKTADGRLLRSRTSATAGGWMPKRLLKPLNFVMLRW